MSTVPCCWPLRGDGEGGRVQSSSEDSSSSIRNDNALPLPFDGVFLGDECFSDRRGDFCSDVRGSSESSSDVVSAERARVRDTPEEEDAPLLSVANRSSSSAGSSSPSLYSLKSIGKGASERCFVGDVLAWNRFDGDELGDGIVSRKLRRRLEPDVDVLGAPEAELRLAEEAEGLAREGK